MKVRKIIIPVLLVYMIFLNACIYIVLPEGLETGKTTGSDSVGWNAVATNIETNGGNLHIDLTLQNWTGDWSTMYTIEDKPVTINTGNTSAECDTVFVNTGGHRVAAGFQLRGYTAGTKQEPAIQLIYVECTDAEIESGSTLSIPYSYVTGQYNYYEQDKNKVDDKMEVNLDEITSDLTYPIAGSVEGLILEPDTEIVAINKIVLTLTDVQRIENGLQFSWQAFNPGEYPLSVHIGNPPVLGEDGILYGFYVTPDIVNVPITPAEDIAEWTTEVQVPQDVKGFYMMLSVETGKARLFEYYAIDITDK